MEHSKIQEITKKLDKLVEEANNLKVQLAEMSEKTQPVGLSRERVQALLIRAVNSGRQSILNEVYHERFGDKVTLVVNLDGADVLNILSNDNIWS